MNWVVSAEVEINFNPEDRPKKHTPIVSWGKLFKLSVVVIDDKKKTHTVSGHSYCGPHDPKKESQSGGTERF